MAVKRVLITGISGYIGSNIARYLVNKGYQVIGIIRENSKIDLLQHPNIKLHTYKDYNSIDAVFKNMKIDVVLHLAALTTYNVDGEDISDLIDSNIKFGTYILSAMTKYGCHKFINTGTYSQHFDSSTEKPVSLYAATKQAFECIISHYVFNKHLSAITIKLFDVYGYNDHRRKIFTLIDEAYNNKTELNMTAGEQFLIMTYIKDVVRSYEEAIKIISNMQTCHERYFIDGDKRSLKEITEAYMQITNKRVKINWGKIPYNKNHIMNPVKTGLPFPNINTTNLETAISEIYEEENIYSNTRI